MILDFFALNELPFMAAPDPKFMYMSSTHRQAHASLLLALQTGRRFVTLLAPPGLGKTILLFHTFKSFGDKVAAVYIQQAGLTPVDLLGAILAELGGHEVDDNPEGMLSRLQDLLSEEHRLGKRVVVAIDEAQDLDASVLDLLCMLSTVETERGSSMQFILSGQPLLTDKLAAIKPMQPMQRGAPVVHLEPFSVEDTAQYVDHRLRAAGYSGESSLFTPEAAGLVARYSQGIPRIVNNLCFEVLATSYRRRREQIGGDIVREVAATLNLAKRTQQSVYVRVPSSPTSAPRAENTAATSAQSASPPKVEAATSVVSAGLPAPQAIEDTNRLQDRPVQVPSRQSSPLPILVKEKASVAPAERPQPVAQEKFIAFSPLPPNPSLETSVEEAGQGHTHPLYAPSSAPIGPGDIPVSLSRPAAPQSPVRMSRIAHRTWAWRPSPVSTIAVAFFLVATAAISGLYRAKTAAPWKSQIISASQLLYPSKPIVQRHEISQNIIPGQKAASGAIVHGSDPALNSSTQEHDLKGMDLQSALRALPSKRQSKQQRQRFR